MQNIFNQLLALDVSREYADFKVVLKFGDVYDDEDERMGLLEFSGLVREALAGSDKLEELEDRVRDLEHDLKTTQRHRDDWKAQARTAEDAVHDERNARHASERLARVLQGKLDAMGAVLTDEQRSEVETPAAVLVALQTTGVNSYVDGYGRMVNKIALIKGVRGVLNLGLKEAKEVVDAGLAATSSALAEVSFGTYPRAQAHALVQVFKAEGHEARVAVVETVEP